MEKLTKPKSTSLKDINAHQSATTPLNDDKNTNAQVRRPLRFGSFALETKRSNKSIFKRLRMIRSRSLTSGSCQSIPKSSEEALGLRSRYPLVKSRESVLGDVKRSPYTSFRSRLQTANDELLSSLKTIRPCSPTTNITRNWKNSTKELLDLVYCGASNNPPDKTIKHVNKSMGDEELKVFPSSPSKGALKASKTNCSQSSSPKSFKNSNEDVILEFKNIISQCTTEITDSSEYAYLKGVCSRSLSSKPVSSDPYGLKSRSRCAANAKKSLERVKTISPRPSKNERLLESFTKSFIAKSQMIYDAKTSNKVLESTTTLGSSSSIFRNCSVQTCFKLPAARSASFSRKKINKTENVSEMAIQNDSSKWNLNVGQSIYRGYRGTVLKKPNVEVLDSSTKNSPRVWSGGSATHTVAGFVRPKEKGGLRKDLKSIDPAFEDLGLRSCAVQTVDLHTIRRLVSKLPLPMRPCTTIGKSKDGILTRKDSCLKESSASIKAKRSNMSKLSFRGSKTEGVGNVKTKKSCSSRTLTNNAVLSSSVNMNKMASKQQHAKIIRELTASMRGTHSRDVQSLKEDCDNIQMVYDTRKRTDSVTTLRNMEILDRILVLSTTGGLKIQSQDKIIHYITHYFCCHTNLVLQLVHIIMDAENLRVCVHPIKILYQLMLQGGVFDQGDRLAMQKVVRTPNIFGNLVECNAYIHLRFYGNREYKHQQHQIHSLLLQIIVNVMNTGDCRKFVCRASTNSVKFMGKLTASIGLKDKELASCILEILKIICTKSSNIDILTSKKFFDGICNCYRLTQKMLSIPVILKSMACNKLALHHMGGNEKIYSIILEMINYTGKRAINKQSLMNTLYKLTKDENGVKTLTKHEVFDKLSQYVLGNNKLKDQSYRLIAIKAYTILNRCVDRILLPITELRLELNLPEDVKKCLEDEHVSDESEPEHDDSDDSQDDDSDEIDNAETSDKKPSMSTMRTPNSTFQESTKENQLVYKLKCARGTEQTTFIPKVLFDLDLLLKYFTKPPNLPHPRTFNSSSANSYILEDFNSLRFESRFECGNLRKATQIDKFEYELMVNPDTCTTKGLQWFYFQVSHMVAKVTYKFNIANFTKYESQYNYGMQPLMFSVMDHSLNKTGWKRAGEEIAYFGNHYRDVSGEKQYRTLSFTVAFKYTNDYVYFAYHYPYTYTRLMINLFPLVNYKSDIIYARIDKLCNTVTKRNEIALITITASWNYPDSLKIPLRIQMFEQKRPVIFITARVHPGETNASWIMEGIIKFLLDKHDSNALKVREYFIFKIIPMLNPEGVIYGNSRAGLTGSDLNRCWAKPNKVTNPEIYYTKRLITCAKRELNLSISAYIDIHGHSRKKFFFFYGCNPTMSWNKRDRTYGDCLEILKLLPEMVLLMNPHIKLSQCRYKVDKCRESTGRVVMWREFNIQHSYTLECSYSFGNKKQTVNTQLLSEVGSSVVASLGKIAERAYISKKTLSSFKLDYSQVDNKPDNTSSKDNMMDGKLLVSFCNSSLNTQYKTEATLPLIVSSRVYGKK